MNPTRSSAHRLRSTTIVAASVVALLGACGGSDAGDAAPNAGADTVAESSPTSADTDATDAETSSDTSTGSDGTVNDEGDTDPGELGGALDAAGSSGDAIASDGLIDYGPAPEVDTGTVVLDGTTHELRGPSRADILAETQGEDVTAAPFDFEICETVNPAFAGAFNIAGTLGDDLPFRLSGTVGEPVGDIDGLWLGDRLEEEQASDLDVSSDGRTLSGTATTSRGDIEFSFTC